MVYSNKIITFFILILFSKSDKILNPVKEDDITDLYNSIINFKFNRVKIKNNNKQLDVINEEEHKIKYNNQLYYLSKNIILCKDESNNYFLLSNNDYYKMTFFSYYHYHRLEKTDSLESVTLIKSLQSDIQYKGYIQENHVSSYSVIENSLSNIGREEIIIYGKKGDYLYFSYIGESDYYILIENFGEIISCKLIGSSRYICAYFKSNKIQISILALKYNKNLQKELSIIDTIQPEGFDDYNDLIIYDTKEKDYKVLCATKKKNNSIKCIAILAKLEYKSINNLYEKEFNSFDLKNSYNEYPSLDKKEYNGYIIEFNSEFLLCYGYNGYNNYIFCRRNNKMFNIINYFWIDLTEDFSSLIITDNSDHSIIYYQTNKNNIYKHYIYPPHCNNTLLQFNSFNNPEIPLSDLFERKTNTNYYLKLSNYFSQYGTVQLGEKNYQHFWYKLNLKPDIDKLNIIFKDNQIINNLRINYNILIEETYFAQCYIIFNPDNSSTKIDEFEFLEQSINIDDDDSSSSCYSLCENCDTGPIAYGNGIIISQNCISCINGYNLMFGTKDCYNESITNQGYYLSSNDLLYHQCSVQCLTCVDETNCKECNIKEGYYPHFNEGSNNCFSYETIKDGYYLDMNEITWKKCYEKCGTCNAPGNSANMNCLSCNQNLTNEKTNLLYDFIFINGNCMEECPNNLFLTSEKECVESCPNDTYEFTYNYTCLKYCPNNYEINKEQNKCIMKSVDNTISSEEFKSQITGNIKTFMNSSDLINGSNFIAVFLASDNMEPKEQLEKGISAIDLGNCTQVIKDYYNISEGFIVLNMESKRSDEKGNDNSFNLGKNNQIEIYDFSGNKLDLSVCKEDIKIMKYLGDVAEDLNIDSAKSYAESGVDIFNASDGFFNDLCHKYDNNDGKDVIIEDRRTDIYKNATFCQDGCTYIGMDYELTTAKCKCDSSFLEGKQNVTDEKKEESEILTFKTITKSFISNLLDFNIEVIFCYNLVFDIKRLSTNIGFYCMSVIFISQIIFLCNFLIKKLKPIKYFMYILKNPNFNINNENKNEQNFPPKKFNFNENEKHEEIELNNKFIIKTKNENCIGNNFNNNSNKEKENNLNILNEDDKTEKKLNLNNNINLDDIQNELKPKNENQKRNY